MASLWCSFFIIIIVFTFSSEALSLDVAGTSWFVDKKERRATTADGNYWLALGGRLMYDYDRTEVNGIRTSDDWGIRRARAYVEGDSKNWYYKVQLNFGNGIGGKPQDLYVRYKGFGEKAVITAGKLKEPFGLEQLVSSNSMTILERNALSEAFTPGHNEGVLFSGKSDGFTYAVGSFDDGDTGNRVFTGRVTYSPVKTAVRVVHLGAAYSDRSSGSDRTGLEFAISDGALHLQSEYMASDDERGNSNIFYVQAGWVITGEKRPYSDGVFKRVKPSTDRGALEVAVRYVDGDGDYSDEGLGFTDGTSYGIGLNYYMTHNVRLGLSYTDSKDNISGASGKEVRSRLQFLF